MYKDLLPGKHLVMDRFSVADTFRLYRTVHKPRRDPSEPVLEPCNPWEGTAVMVSRVSHDIETGEWKMWYIAFNPDLEQERIRLKKSKYGNVGQPQPYYLCFAKSADGIHWERPALNLYESTNICFKGVSGVYGGSILEMPDASRERRYLLVNCEWRDMETGGIYIAYSSDGIHWEYPAGDKPLIHGESDCNNGIVFNVERGVYMLYLRGWHAAAVGWIPNKNTRRRVAYSESADLVHWSEPQIILTPDELDTNDFYGMSPFRYANGYFSQLWIHDDDGKETIETQLAWSRDGICWERHPERPRFLETGEKGEIDGYMVLPALEPVRAGDNLYIYYTAHSGLPHDTQISRYRSIVYRAKLRMDGFVSLDADRRPGCLVTRPFTLAGDCIEINAATQGGRIVAELVEPHWHDPEGKPIEGFSADDFDVFEGDSIRHRLSWRGRSDLGRLRGRRLLLRMMLVHAQIYSFTI